MSGHSHWATIKRKKGANDAKRGQAFTRLGREIAVAAREGGPDPDSNFKLRLVVDKARAAGMPKDNIERAIRRGAGLDKDAVAFEEATFEGYGPHGVAMIVKVVTDNRNRTISDLRRLFTRSGGKVLRSHTLKAGNRAGQAFRLAAQAVSRKQDEFGAYYRRQRARLGPEQAIVATAHKIARAFYHVLKHRTPFRSISADDYNQHVRDREVAHLKKKATQLGFTLAPTPAPA